MNEENRGATNNYPTSEDLEKLIDSASLIKNVKEKRASVNDIMLLGLRSQINTLKATNDMAQNAIKSSNRIAYWTMALAFATFLLAITTIVMKFIK